MPTIIAAPLAVILKPGDWLALLSRALFAVMTVFVRSAVAAVVEAVTKGWSASATDTSSFSITATKPLAAGFRNRKAERFPALPATCVALTPKRPQTAR